MQTSLADWIRDTPEGKTADAILRKCVHCGFCTATCPTYQLLGDELDGPRGRIYLIKQVLEGSAVTAKTQLHLDRCLTCRSCETTCPSGVQYGQLVDIGRKVVEDRVGRSPFERMTRRAIATLFPRTGVFNLMTRAGMAMRPFVPSALAGKLPKEIPAAGEWPAPRHARRMIALAGCVQPALTPDTNAAAARVLDRLGVSLVEAPGAGCCGALRFHLNFQDEGLDDMRRMIDAWWPLVQQGAEVIVMTASGCGATVREYGHHLARDPRYAEKAARVSAITRDLSEVLDAEVDRLVPLVRTGTRPLVAFHPPCTLQHWQPLKGVTEGVLARLGYELAPVPDSHMCCGAAGTYALTQPELAERLKKNKVTALQSGLPEAVLTSNVGCQTHLASGATVPVRHWIVDVDGRLGGQS
ncbi:MAG TPA: glycolate oxidase subunit GlcF [Burkholderiales bacterium]|nr:glycolate oxidase subunit GlcF [Burkholderiales bacterium]